MLDKITGALRTAASDALPADFPVNRVMWDAVENDATVTPAAARAVSVTIESGSDSRQMSMGAAPRFRTEGYLTMTFYEPNANRGDGALLTLVSSVADQLRNAVRSGTGYSVRLYAPSVSNGFRSGSHFARTLRVPFRADYYPAVS